MPRRITERHRLEGLVPEVERRKLEKLVALRESQSGWR